MRKFVFGALGAAVAFLGAIPAWAQGITDPQFIIRADNGEVIGVQETQSSEGRLHIIRRLRFSIDGHEPVNLARRVTLSPSGQAGSFRAAPHWLVGLNTGPRDEDAGVALAGRTIPFPSADDADRELYIAMQDDFPAVIWLISRDKDGTIQRATLPGFGNSQHFSRASDAEIASASFGSASVPHPMISIPYDITRQAREGHMRWRTRLPEEVVAMLPQTGQQRISFNDGEARFDICATCGPGLPDDPESLAAATQSTPWLQAGDRRFRTIARNVRKRSASDSEIMAELSRIARRRLSGVDFSGNLTASEAWDRRAGDCTEDAVLLATLARATGIPAYVANGMVYSRERFHGTHDALLPHSWVVAYVDGAWRSYDMTLAEGFGATHIALTLGDGSARSVAASHMLAGLIEWDAMSEVRQRPAD